MPERLWAARRHADASTTASNAAVATIPCQTAPSSNTPRTIRRWLCVGARKPRPRRGSGFERVMGVIGSSRSAWSKRVNASGGASTPPARCRARCRPQDSAVESQRLCRAGRAAGSAQRRSWPGRARRWGISRSHADLARWAALREEIEQCFAAADELNLDRKHAMLSAFFAIEEPAR